MKNESLVLDVIVQRCITETARYRQTGESDSSFCFELFRRALGENNHDAFSEIYKIYKPQLEVWAKSHSLMPELDISAEICASETLIRAWKYLAGNQFSAKVENYPQILVYLRKTLNTIILEAYRKIKRRITEVEISDRLADDMVNLSHSSDTNVFEIMNRIEEIIPSIDDRMIVLCKIQYGMTPAEMLQKFPERWESSEYISRRIYILRKRLQNDPKIRELAGL
jgi:hypothetical protein